VIAVTEPVDHSLNRATMDIIAEEWRPVPRANGRYMVSSLGRVKSLERVIQCGIRHGKTRHRTVRERILRLAKDCDGYAMATFSMTEGGRPKSHKVHQLVAHAFLGKQPDGTWVLHGINGKEDNRVENLYYGTPAQNVKDKWRDGTIIVGEKHHKAKLKEADVIEIRELHEQGLTCKAIAARYGVYHTAIAKIINRQNWRWL